jgi:type I restriction enzyme R subunit
MLLEQSNITSNELSRVCNNQSLGIFIRSILGLERNAVSSIFAEFLERSQYNSRQIDFINAIVNSFTVNGTLEPKMLYQPPFTEIDSNSVSGLFNDPDCEKIITLMKQINIKSVA